MQSSSTPTREGQEKLLTPHEYIRDTTIGYEDCISCGNRTEFSCVKCGYCYSCHWKKEQVEEIELRNNLKDFYASISNTRNDSKDNDEQDPNPLQTPKLDKWETMDVFGQQAEPICTYYRCNHTFSAHGLGTRGCKCKHPTNETLGISLRVL